MKTGRGALVPIVLIFLLSTGCQHYHPARSVVPPPESIIGDSGSDNLKESLFKGDQAVLSDQDIARILATQVKLADRHRLAVLNLTRASFWSEDLAEIESRNFDNFLGVLKSSPQLTEVRFLPSLLVPEKRTVPYLREAAARIQADLLLVYTSRIQSFRRDRFLKPDEVHAQCQAESVLLDVRTGIVLDTARATENISLKKATADANFTETVARAESEARGKALVSLANAAVKHWATETR
ncbi:MAG TPA: hypothetical protein VG759_10150 [Candidatus Angelobacter sp.]|nr:hypothetical protein [Candidatus Angelobacter sp.]